MLSYLASVLLQASAQLSADALVVGVALEAEGVSSSCFVASISSHLLSDVGKLVDGAAQSDLEAI